MFDLEAHWCIHFKCNFGCPYCIGKARQREKYYDPSTLTALFMSQPLRWHIHITGGEPFLYPRFVDICKILTSRHTVSIYTNLSSPLVEEFGEAISPERVGFIDVGTQILERRKAGGADVFAERFLRLRSRGFTVFTSQVICPGHLADFEHWYRLLSDRGITMYPKMLRGDYRRKHYPDAYTEGETAFFREYSRLAHSTGDTDFSKPEMALVDLRLDEEFIRGIPVFKGKKCSAGSKFIRIWPNGTITKCDANTILGNLFAGELSLLEGPEKCNTKSCPYFCSKYSRLAHEKGPTP